MQVNGKTCWQKKLVGGQGSQECGQKHGGWHEARLKVTCQADAVDGKLAVRIYTDLNSGASDESFGIDNVVVSKVTATISCKAYYYIKNNKCVACPSGSTCDGTKATPCASLKYVNNNKCLACPNGSTCDGTKASACAATNYVNGNKCVACPSGSTCDGTKATPCPSLKYVNNNNCLACPMDSTCDGTKATVCKPPNIVKDNKCEEIDQS